MPSLGWVAVTKPMTLISVPICMIGSEKAVPTKPPISSASADIAVESVPAEMGRLLSSRVRADATSR